MPNSLSTTFVRAVAVVALLILAACSALVWAAEPSRPATPIAGGEIVGTPGDELVIVDKGATTAVVIVSPKAGPTEKAAAADLVKYIEIMSGGKPALADNDAAIAAALASKAPLLIVGSETIKAEPGLTGKLEKVAKKKPILRADAIAIHRKGNRVYIAGNNDDAHYYAVAKLLREWGCRWYLPTEFGECIPEQKTLKVGAIDYAFGSPLEVRGYWISWNGDPAGAPEFRLRNMMNNQGVGGGHSLGLYTKDIIPPGKTMMNIPIAEDKTAEAVANHPVIDKSFKEGKEFSLGMEDGVYESDSARDAELRANLFDKYFITPTLTDNFMEFYNKTCAILLKKYPESKSYIGFLAYSNITFPPQREITAAKPLMASLAPIDFDPNHSMDDERSPAKQEQREIMYRWSKVMEGRLFVYDYDQGMLVWRDIPNPIVQWFAADVKHYVKAGMLGVNTECRNAIATVFVNLYFRGQLLWDPDADSDALLADFYPRFYGPMAEPMSKYWGAIYKAWADTLVTEHEYMAIPAIYTPELIADLKKHLEAGEARMKDIGAKLGELPRDWKKYQERMKFTRLSFNLIEQYCGAVRAAASEGDFAKAASLGDKAIATRLELADMNTTFTTRISPKMPAPETVAGGPAWMMGEIEQYRKLNELMNGDRGTLVTKLPLSWAFHRDPHDTGVAMGYAYNPVDLSYWEKHGKQMKPEQRKDYPTNKWEMLNIDVYAQAQGILHPDWQSFTGHLWYRTDVKISAEQAKGKLHVMFPGMFNEAWLYVNGYLVSHRKFPALWWNSDYKFEWDVDLTGVLKPGENSVTVRLANPHHFGGLFRRPFIYAAK